MALSATISFLIRQFDERVADKATRDKFYDDVMKFSYRQPFIASFVLMQLMFALLPLLGFLGFTIGVVVVTLGICGFWVGVGLCVLCSTLAFTATIATVVWACACGSFVCARWVMEVLVGRSERSAPPAPPIKEASGSGGSKGVQAKAAYTTSESSGSDDGSALRRTLTPPPEDRPSLEAEKLRRDIERSLR